MDAVPRTELAADAGRLSDDREDSLDDAILAVLAEVVARKIEQAQSAEILLTGRGRGRPNVSLR